MDINIVTPPSVEPVTVDEIKNHLRFGDDGLDDYLQILISTAREMSEIETARALLTQTWAAKLDRFPCGGGVIELPYPPLQIVSSITYTDDAGNIQTLDESEYQVDIGGLCGRVAPVDGNTWPDTDQYKLSAVTVTFVAGWENAESVPNAFKHVIKLLVGHWFDNTQAVTMEGTPKEMPFAVKALLSHWKVPFIG